MSVKEELHRLIEALPDEQALELLDDLRDAADLDGPPLDADAVGSLDRGLADIAAGRVKPLEDYERERGL